MKKIYTLAAALIAGGVVFGQQAIPAKKMFSVPAENVSNELPEKVARKKTNKIVTSAQKSVGFFEDFSDGLTGWTQESLNPTYQFWEETTTGQTYFVPSPALEFAAPTAANGYALLDIGRKSIDELGGSGLLVNPVKVTLTSPVMNLTGMNNPKITFWEQFRHCCNAQFRLWLDISTDGGANFSVNNSIDITDGVSRNSTGDEVFGGIEITRVIKDQIASNPANVVIRFRWDTETPDQNGQTSDVYFWHIDDIVIEENLDYELELKHAYYGDAVVQFDYKQIPSSQVQNYLLGARVKNNGNIAQNAKVVARITSPNGYDQTFKSSTVNLYSLIDTNIFFPTFTSPPIGDYTVTYSFESANLVNDGKPENNEDSATFRVTESIYSHDPGNWNRNGGSVITHYTKAGVYVPYSIGLFYNAFANGQVHHINTIFPNTRTVRITEDQQIAVDFFKMADPFNPAAGDFDSNYPNYTVYVDVTEAMITDTTENPMVLHIGLPSPAAIEAGQIYFAQISANGDTEILNIAEAGEADDNGTRVFGDLGGAGAAWYGTSDAPVIRLSTSSTNVDNIGKNAGANFTLAQNQPNPFNGVSLINYTLNETGNVTFSVVDITGKEVMNVNNGVQTAGNHKITLNANSFNAGIYFYSLNVNGKSITKKMIITE